MSKDRTIVRASTEPPHTVRVQLHSQTYQTRVWLDGHEVSHLVTRLIIDANVQERFTGIALDLVSETGIVAELEGTVTEKAPSDA